MLTDFRLAVLQDANEIVRLVNQAYRPENPALTWTNESLLVSGDRIRAEQVIDLITLANSFVLLGFNSDNALCACIHIEKHQDSAYLGMLSVNAMQQNKGIGKAMLLFAETYARSLGFVKSTMVVLSARTALIEFYLRRGYRQVGDKMAYPMDADVGIPKQENLTIEMLEKTL